MTDDQQKLAEENVKIAFHRASYWFKRTGMDYSECESVAQWGLCKAAIFYKPDRGTKFSTYAFRAIDNMFRKYVRDQHTLSRKANRNTLSTNTIIHAVEMQDLFEHWDDYYFEVFDDFPKYLSQKEMKLIYLYYIQGHSQTEIAEVFKVSQTHICRMLTAAINKLKKVMCDEPEGKEGVTARRT